MGAANISITTFMSHPHDHPRDEKVCEETRPTSIMCRYTYGFYECGHRQQDHVDQCEDARDGRRGAGHCDPDTSAEVRRQIQTVDRHGVCNRCLNGGHAALQTRIEEDSVRRDVEKLRRLDEEEQRRSRKAHEAHMRN